MPLCLRAVSAASAPPGPVPVALDRPGRRRPADRVSPPAPGGEAELEVIYETAPVGLCVIDAACRFVRINARMAAFNGVPVADHIGRSIREVVPALADAGEALVRRIVQTGQPVHGIEIEGETPAAAGVRRIWVEDWHPLRDADGRVWAVNVVAREVTEDRNAARAAAEREALLTTVLEALPVGIGVIGMDGRLTLANAEMRRFVPEVIPSRDDARRALWRGQHPDGRPILPQDYPGARALRGETVLPGIEFRCGIGPGEEAWTRVAAKPLRDGEGRVTGAVAVVTDITASKAAEARQEVLTRELAHRVKNALSVVLAALRLTPRTNAEAYARSVEGRVAALSRAHDLLRDGDWQGAGLRPLVEAELAPFLDTTVGGEATRRPVVTLAGPALRVLPAAAQAVAMALHELATNAVKHGALSDPAGTVSLTWRRDAAAGLLRLRWAERGGPPVAGPPARKGFGSRMLDATIRRQLGGRLELSWEPAGLVCEIGLPLAHVVVGDGHPDGDTAAAAGAGEAHA